MRMGFAEIDITPQAPVTMVGFNRTDNMSRGILDPLSAQVSVWGDEDKCCLVSIDNIGFNKKEANILRDKIGELLNTARDRIMLSFSHTHAAVNVSVEKEYFNMLCCRICEAVKEARASMCKVSVGWSNVQADIGNNRRKHSDKIDRRVGILKICSSDSNELKLTILRLTAHCNVLKSDNYFISADYFGAVRRAFIEKYHCPIMLIQGSAGNIAPKYYKASYIPIDGQGDDYINCENALDRMAQEVIKNVEQEFDAIGTSAAINVCAYSKYIPMQVKVPSMDEARKIANDALRYCNINGEKWLKEIERLHSSGITAQYEYVEMQYFRVGDWILCGIPNETMAEFAIESERLLENHFFYFNGYTNGCSSYFPTKEEYDLGGYEVYWAILIYFADYGRVYPYNRDAIDTVISNAIEVPILFSNKKQ